MLGAGQYEYLLPDVMNLLDFRYQHVLCCSL